MLADCAVTSVRIFVATCIVTTIWWFCFGYRPSVTNCIQFVAMTFLMAMLAHALVVLFAQLNDSVVESIGAVTKVVDVLVLFCGYWFQRRNVNAFWQVLIDLNPLHRITQALTGLANEKGLQCSDDPFAQSDIALVCPLDTAATLHVIGYKMTRFSDWAVVCGSVFMTWLLAWIVFELKRRREKLPRQVDCCIEELTPPQVFAEVPISSMVFLERFSQFRWYHWILMALYSPIGLALVVLRSVLILLVGLYVNLALCCVKPNAKTGSYGSSADGFSRYRSVMWLFHLIVLVVPSRLVGKKPDLEEMPKLVVANHLSELDFVSAAAAYLPLPFAVLPRFGSCVFSAFCSLTKRITIAGRDCEPLFRARSRNGLLENHTGRQHNSESQQPGVHPSFSPRYRRAA